MKRELVLIPFCIVASVFTSGCSKSSSTSGSASLPDKTNIPPKRVGALALETQDSKQTNSWGTASAKISEGAEPILQYPYAQPLPEWLNAIKPQDKGVLLSRYRNEAQLTNKYALTIALSLVGDAEVAEEFKKTLIKTPFDHTLDFNEEVVLDRTITSLGMIARSEDSVLPFLRQAADPRFWKQNVPWKSHLGDRQYGVFAGRALAALAISGAPDARDVFEQVKANPYVTDTEGSGWALNASVVTAVFLADFLQERGFDAVKAMYAHQRLFETWRIWAGTENGTQWVSWSNQWEKDHPKEAGNVPP